MFSPNCCLKRAKPVHNKRKPSGSTKAMKKSSDSPWWTFFLGIYLTQLFFFPQKLCRSHSHIYLRWQFLTLFSVRCDECSLNAVQMTAQSKACSSSFIHAVNKIKEAFISEFQFGFVETYSGSAPVLGHFSLFNAFEWFLRSKSDFDHTNFKFVTEFSLDPKAPFQPRKLLIRFFPPLEC